MKPISEAIVKAEGAAEVIRWGHLEKTLVRVSF